MGRRHGKVNFFFWCNSGPGDLATEIRFDLQSLFLNQKLFLFIYPRKIFELIFFLEIKRRDDEQRWANNSVFEYYSNTWGRILVFIFVFGWLFETEYYSYSYSGDFLKPNNIRIRIRWEFFPNTICILLSIDTFDEPKNVEDAKIPAKPLPKAQRTGYWLFNLSYLSS